MNNTLISLDIVKSHKQGKVRDIYDLGDKLLIVTSDRISAFDVVFSDEIKNKGKILNQISVNFFKMTNETISNHFITDNVDEYPVELHPFRSELEDRSMLVKKTKVIPFECIVRSYITGSAWKEYQNTGMVAGLSIPEKMKESQKFPELLFTPSTKEENGHDENISFEEMSKRMDTILSEKIKNISLKLFKFAHEFLLKKDIILADTKFEFGTIGSELILIDEIFTPDSSRFWDKNEYKIGQPQKSFDKQYLRDYLNTISWDKNPPAPKLPKEIIQKTFDKYYLAYTKIAEENGKKWK